MPFALCNCAGNHGDRRSSDHGKVDCEECWYNISGLRYRRRYRVAERNTFRRRRSQVIPFNVLIFIVISHKSGELGLFVNLEKWRQFFFKIYEGCGRHPEEYTFGWTAIMRNEFRAEDYRSDTKLHVVHLHYITLKTFLVRSLLEENKRIT